MLLFVGPGKILQVPSFTLATGCSVPSYPISGLRYAVTGVVDNKIMTCGGKQSAFIYLLKYIMFINGIRTNI